MARVDQTVQPYAYPAEPHRRRHGPAGYANYRQYRSWLEDEFVFRCVYCLKRMVWAPTDIWAVDHLIPRDEAPERECEYDNLVFACQFCNEQKGSNRVPDPCKVAYGKGLRVDTDGTVTALNPHGQRLVKVLNLNHPFMVEERRKNLRVLSSLQQSLQRDDQELFLRLMGFPQNLPDLAKRSPPHNSRPQGISESWLAKRNRGELRAVY